MEKAALFGPSYDGRSAVFARNDNLISWRIGDVLAVQRVSRIETSDYLTK
jgi:hypothetical protein